MKYLLLIFLFSISTIFGNTFESIEFKSYSLNNFIENITKETQKYIPKESNIAILEITGKSTLFSNKELKSKFITKLINLDSFNYIDKNLLSNSKSEINLSDSKYFNPKEAIQLGRLHSVSHFLLINIDNEIFNINSDSKVILDTLNYKIFDVEKGLLTHSKSFEIKYKMKSKRKSSAILKSFFFSGYGHLYLRKPFKALFYTIVGNLPVAGTGYFLYKSQSNYSKYKDQTNQSEMNKYYDLSNKYKNYMEILLGTSLAIKILETVNIINYPQVSLERKQLLSITPYFSYDEISVYAQLKF